MVGHGTMGWLVGVVLGFLAGLGVGGGSMLMLYLTLCLAMPQETARGINLLFFMVSASVSTLFRWRQGAVSMKKILPAALAGSIMSGIFAWFSHGWDLELLRKLFGVLLLVTGLRELLGRRR